jgi:hypothetical protein
MSDEYLFLLAFIGVCLVLVYFLGRSPVTSVVETHIVGKRVRYQQTITASGNAYVPIKHEVYSIDTEITYDVSVSKSLWDKLDTGEPILLNKHLNGDYSFKKRVKG